MGVGVAGQPHDNSVKHLSGLEFEVPQKKRINFLLLKKSCQLKSSQLSAGVCVWGCVCVKVLTRICVLVELIFEVIACIKNW